jgi:hypothetical protein
LPSLREKLVGRLNGKRIRDWFATEEAAKAEATERNIKLRRLGSAAAEVDNALIIIASEGAGKFVADYKFWAHLRKERQVTMRAAVVFDIQNR